MDDDYIEEDWGSCAEGSELLAQSYPDKDIRAIKILDAARAGFIAGRARAATITSMVDGQPSIDRLANYQIPDWVWRAAKWTGFDVSASTLRMRESGTRGREVSLSGVSFHSQMFTDHFGDVIARTPFHEQPRVSDDQNTTGDSAHIRINNANARFWDWEPVLIELVAFAYHEGLHDMNLGERGGQAKLEKWFATTFNAITKSDREPSETERRKRAQAVMTAIELQRSRISDKKP